MRHLLPALTDADLCRGIVAKLAHAQEHAPEVPALRGVQCVGCGVKADGYFFGVVEHILEQAQRVSDLRPISETDRRLACRKCRRKGIR